MLPTLDSETFGKMGSKNLLETEMGVLRDQINGTVQPSLNIRTNDEIMSSWNASGQNLAAFSNTLQQRATEAGNTVLANGGTAEESDAARIKSLREGLVELGMLPTLDSDTFGKPSYQILLEAEMTTIRGQINGGTTTEKTGNDETTIANSRDFNSNSGITLQSIANTLTSGPTRIRPEEPSLISKPKDIYNDKIKESYLSSKAYQAAQAVIRNSNQTFSKQINT
jgi:hypothetical protein